MQMQSTSNSRCVHNKVMTPSQEWQYLSTLASLTKLRPSLRKDPCPSWLAAVTVLRLARFDPRKQSLSEFVQRLAEPSRWNEGLLHILGHSLVRLAAFKRLLPFMVGTLAARGRSSAMAGKGEVESLRQRAWPPKQWRHQHLCRARRGRIALK